MRRDVLDHILLLKRLGIRVTCQTPVNTYTAAELPAIAEWCYANGIRFTCSNETTDSYYRESRRSCRVDDEVFARMKEQIRQVDAPVSSKPAAPVERKFGYRHHFDCVSGRHTFAISYSGRLRPCFNIWEADCRSFDGAASMKQAMREMTACIERMRETVIEGCHGCEASQLCSECLYTRLKHREDPEAYMRARCAENLARIRGTGE